MQDDVGAERKRSLKVRGHESVVRNHQKPLPFRHGGKRRDICDRKKRIGRRLYEDSLGVRSKVFFEFFPRLAFKKGVFQTETGKDLVQNAESSAVYIFGKHDPIARLEKRQDRRYGRHAGGKREAGGSAFQISYQSLQCRTCRIAGPGIFPTGRFSQFFLSVSGSLVDWDIDCAGLLVAVDSAVDNQSFVFHGFLHLIFFKI